jgi:hypothetical protein
MCSLQQNNLTPSLFIPPTHIHTSLSFPVQFISNQRRETAAAAEWRRCKRWLWRYGTSTSLWPSQLTNVRDIYTKVWVSGHAWWPRTIAAQKPHRNKQTNSRHLMPFWFVFRRHLIERKEKKVTVNHCDVLPLRLMHRAKWNLCGLDGRETGLEAKILWNGPPPNLRQPITAPMM